MVRHVITVENVMELQGALKDKNNAQFAKKLEVVALRGEYSSNEVVASLTDVSPQLVCHYVSIYCNGGLDALLCRRKPKK